MHINLKYLKLHNFLSFEDGELDLNSSGYTLVQGINKNAVDMAVSNGSGKSSIFEAISWCITGELIRGSRNVKRLSAKEKDSCWVSLEFDIDDNKYGIIRQSNPSKLKFNVNGEDVSGKGIRDTEKIIQEYLPNLTSSLIGSVIILGQGLPQRFSNNTPSGRKEVLETLSNSDVMILDIKDRIFKRLNELLDKERELQDNKLKLITQKEMKENEISLLFKKLKELPERIELQNQIDNLKEIINKYNNNIESTNSVLKELTETSYKLSRKKEEKVSEKFNAISLETHEIDIKLVELKEKCTEYQTLIKTKQQEVLKLKNIKDVCPTCGQKLPNVEKVDTSNLEQEVKDLNNILIEFTNKFENLNQEKNDLIIKINNQFETNIKKLDTDINDNNSKIHDLNDQLLDINQKLRHDSIELSKLESSLLNYDITVDELNNGIEEGKKYIQSVSNKILYINNDNDQLQEHISIVQKMKSVVTRDFRGYLLTSVIDFINRKAKEYSQEVFETDKIDFILDGNNIDIYYDKKEYSNLSGGEKQKIDLIVQFSIRDMLCKYLNFGSNIIVVDELFDNLDSIGCEKILNLISNKLNDVENIYIITHHADIPIPFDNILTVTKGEDGISRIN